MTKFDSMVSDPIQNYLKEPSGNLRFYIDNQAKIYNKVHSEKTSLIKFFKHKLGRQSYCWVGYRRYWIWQYPEYRIFVNNERGITFEVVTGMPNQKALSLYKNFLNEIGIKHETEKI